ncbi:MAG TPA: DUF2934 domain-containing protein [Acidobacteriaceae bacterium]|nr:DUF2934 domain-containing protein [Acidobacteriaceae bacterium]
MAETTEKGKKAKAAAKPRAAAGTKTSTKKTTKKTNGAAAEMKSPYVPSHEEIAFLALQYWEQRGCQHGQDQQDWLRAEQELTRMAS